MSTATETPKTGRAAVAALLNDQPAKNGAQLVKALALSGTPGVRLQPARDALAAAHREGRTLTAADVLAVMEEAGTAPGTLEKARALAETGKLRASAPPSVPIEDQILGDSPAAMKPPEAPRQPVPKANPSK